MPTPSQSRRPGSGHTLTALFEPRSVAVVGASDDPSKIGGRPLHLLKAARFALPIYPVNPARSVVQGLDAYARITETPTRPDLAIVAVPAAHVLATFDDVVAAGARAAIVYTSGFAEIGAEGVKVQAELTARARASGVRVLGPNCLGVINTRSKLIATFSGAVGHAPPRPGSIGLASQSGALGAHCLVLAERRGIAFSVWATSGNESDIDVAELIAYMATDPGTHVIVACIEGVRDAGRLIEALELARTHGKQIVMMKVGSSPIGAAAAASHTASMVGSDQVFDAVLREFGVYRAHSIEDMLDVAYALTVHQSPRGRSLAVVTTSGGVGVLLADEAERLGVDMPELPAIAQARIRELLPYAGTRNPVDVTAQITNTPEILGPMLDALLASGTVGSLLLFLSHLGLNAAMMRRLMPALTALSKRPGPQVRVACLLACDEVRQELEALGFSVFEDPTRAIRTVAALMEIATAQAQARPARTLPRLPDTAHAVTPGMQYSETEAKRLVRSIGIQTLPERIAQDPAQAAAIATELGFPVALKIVSPEILHKSDVGGVQLAVQTADEARSVYTSMMAPVRRNCPQARIDGIAIAPMARPGVDLILGCIQDPTFGPCLMLGSGGVYTEILADAVIRRAPFDAATARSMIAQLKGAPLLDGARGMPRADTDALAQAVAMLSVYAYANRRHIESLEINPLRVLPAGQGVVALDALATTVRHPTEPGEATVCPAQEAHS
ncbi:acetyl-CoA synthetase [Bordetella pertussis]|nr:acetyl-CoA synthetase [Bordetella pertussis]